MALPLAAFALKAGLPAADVERLGRLGLLPPPEELEERHVPIAKLLAVLEASGYSAEQLAELVATGSISLEHLDRGFVRSRGMRPGSLRSVAAETGLSDGFVDEVQLALGIADHDDGTVRVDDAELLSLLGEMVTLGVAEPVVVNLLQVMAEGIRKTTRAATEMWNAGVLQPLLDAGMPFAEIVAAQSLNGGRLQDIGAALVSTLWRRFLEDQIFGGTIDLLEAALAETGLERPSTSGPPCIAFVDLTAFTALTDRKGDDVAAQGAQALRAVVRKAIVRHGGTLVKMLGDGAMLHFAATSAALATAIDLVRSVPAAGLPPARVGIDAGAVVVRDVDYYGTTVNVAARLVDYARPGEILVTANVVEVAGEDGFAFDEIGEVSLKGIAAPVHVYAVARPN